MALSVIFNFEAHAVSFVEGTNAGSFERGSVNEDILAALAALSLANSEVITVSDKAAIKLERGTKRTCQNPECRERFYDLNRDPIPAQSVTTCMLLRSSLHRKYRRVFRQGRTRNGHLCPRRAEA